ncbi:hypothetical protein [Aporhodopirellula aestuarii]|uniref:Uncharacterized protein n=1 Tax=Aporhodopirellula aestuarii TaxID=2950107 RepID=A0ABT0U4D1_9BACT|nr:hypothetical protein [Aporhodopirellula aestuarii]MCM2371780.1 hypothetical protein [Aporhodopirellula aestuarii]
MNYSPRFVSPQPQKQPATAGEIIDDAYHSTPSTNVQPLSPEVLQHWGLIGCPFAPERTLDQPHEITDFYFRTSSHASACSWLQNVVKGSGSLAVLTTSSGAGTTTWLRQIASTSGLGETALETAAIEWNNESLDQLTSDLATIAGDIQTPSRVKTLWLIHVADSPATQTQSAQNRLAVMAGWQAARAAQLRNLHILLIIPRKRQATSGIASLELAIRSKLPHHHLSRPHASELRRCVNVAIHHAGGLRPVFTVSAVTQLADSSRGSIRRLGALVHAALVHGQITGIRQITSADLSAPLFNHAETKHDATSRAA